MKIAVVEDDDGVAGAIVDGLAMHRLDAVHLRRGQDILLRHGEFTVVLLDLGLPDMDGIDVVRDLRKVTAIPVVILTARDDERSVVRGLRAGADDYLVKPARMAELLARIEAVRRRIARAAPDSSARRDFGDVII